MTKTARKTTAKEFKGTTEEAVVQFRFIPLIFEYGMICITFLKNLLRHKEMFDTLEECRQAILYLNEHPHDFIYDWSPIPLDPGYPYFYAHSSEEIRYGSIRQRTAETMDEERRYILSLILKYPTKWDKHIRIPSPIRIEGKEVEKRSRLLDIRPKLLEKDCLHIRTLEEWEQVTIAEREHLYIPLIIEQGLYIVLRLLAIFEEQENYEECQKIMTAIHFLNQNKSLFPCYVKQDLPTTLDGNGAQILEGMKIYYGKKKERNNLYKEIKELYNKIQFHELTVIK